MPKISETETVVKRIVPYLIRRGYDLENDMRFEFPAPSEERAKMGFIDILIEHKSKPAFLIEAKRASKRLTAKEKAQAIGYARSIKCPFVVVTNGHEFLSYNTNNSDLIRWDGKSTEKIPNKNQLPKALSEFKKNPDILLPSIVSSDSLPFRPGLPLKQLNALFARCHNAIRKIEKKEEDAFADFSKILFLKLLEEKADYEDFDLPYSYQFHELSALPQSKSDQVKSAINAMISEIRSSTPFGEVLSDGIKLKQGKTFKYIVDELSKVSFQDSGVDSKGAAFEYFVRATLKGKKLGQYFTPRAVIELMQAALGREKIIQSLAFSQDFKVLDPACGTGGFLVYLLLNCLEQITMMQKQGKITQATAQSLSERVKASVFFGMDANDGVAASAKMNMIIAGDGHTNIHACDSLKLNAPLWKVNEPDADIIMTNPPFGTSESQSLDNSDLSQFPVGGNRGQILFLQKMILSTKPGGEICTVIDEGILNTDQSKDLRRFILEHCVVRGLIELPEVTFKPNKITVKSAVLHLTKREITNPDLDDEYLIRFFKIGTLGYDGTGTQLRGVNFDSIISEFENAYHERPSSEIAEVSSAHFEYFDINSKELQSANAFRIDLKFWQPRIKQRVDALIKSGKGIRLGDIVTTPIRRGRSPSSSLYVDRPDGYALVVKAGSNISKFGEVIVDGDWIEKDVYDEMENVHVQSGDILLSSTGDGTLGKCAIFRGEYPAIADGHVSIIRIDCSKFRPEYVADYLRTGFGSAQVQRLFTGSTGLIELPHELVNEIIIFSPFNLEEQLKASQALRERELSLHASANDAVADLEKIRLKFLEATGKWN